MRRMRVGIGLVLLGWVALWSVAGAARSEPAAPVPWKQSSAALALAADGATLFVVNPDSNSLSLVDTASRAVLLEVPVGLDPRSVAVAAAGDAAYVANRGSDSVSVVRLGSQIVVQTVAVGDRPVGVALAPDGRTLAVAELGADRVRLLETADLRLRTLFAVADRPHGLAFTPDGQHLLVTHLLSGHVTVLDLRWRRLYLPVVLRRGSSIRASENQESRIQQRTSSNPQPASHTQHPTSNIETWPNVAPAPGVVVDAAGTRAYLPQTMAHGQGLNTQFDNTVFPKVSVLDLTAWEHRLAEHVSLPETDRPVGLPWDVALAREGAELWVVNAASNDVSVVDLSEPTRPRRRAHVPVGHNPRGIVLSPDGTTAYVNNTLAGTVSVIDAHAYTVTDVITVTQIPLPPTLLHGKRLFFSSARPGLARAAWISCNTCHVEGEHDGRTWLLQYIDPVPPGATPVITRNTTSLLGMAETYPLRWSAEWDESADSEFSVRFEQFGTGLIEGEMHPTLGPLNGGRSYDLDCLAAFIDGLAVPARTHALTPAEARGRAIFESPATGCADCHPAPLYTDLHQHDVGTAVAYGEWFGPRIDTPTLRFLYDSAPYLHDGSAATLYDVLTTANPDDAHGVTSHLTPQELADLIAFLSALPY